MMIPNIQAWCRILSTRLVKHVTTSSFGCGLQFYQPNSTYAQVNPHRTAAIDPNILKFITPFKNVPSQQSKSHLSPRNFSNVNKITLRLPGLNKPEDFIDPVPSGYLNRLPLKKTLPPFTHQEKLDPVVGVEIREPSTIHSNLEKFTARLIQIRKMKMKKHRLRKLRKRMFFVWAKLKQRRAARKEKHFIDCRLARIKTAEDFNAEEWVNEYLKKSTTDPETLILKKPKRPRPTRYVF